MMSGLNKSVVGLAASRGGAGYEPPGDHDICHSQDRIHGTAAGSARPAKLAV